MISLEIGFLKSKETFEFFKNKSEEFSIKTVYKSLGFKRFLDTSYTKNAFYISTENGLKVLAKLFNEFYKSFLLTNALPYVKSIQENKKGNKIFAISNFYIKLINSITYKIKK